jgi:hypothetical protein
MLGPMADASSAARLAGRVVIVLVAAPDVDRP